MIKYLLDTHAILWIAENSPRLSEKAKDVIINPDTIKYVSVASAWEVAIKLSIGKLKLHEGLSEFYQIIHSNRVSMLPIEESYLEELVNLPFIHKDPFDRLLVATALTESMTILTADENIHKYNVNWLW